MSKKLYDHLISTNYEKIFDKIKEEKKKSNSRKISTKQDNVATQ